MKKAVICICSLAMVFSLLSPITISSRAEASSADAQCSEYTEVIVPSFLNRDGEKITVTSDMAAFPSSVQKNNYQFTPAEDPSNFNLSTGMKYTNPSEDVRSEICVSPMTYAETSGYLIRIKSDTENAFRMSIRVLYNGSASKYQYSGVNWYTLDSDDTQWQESSVYKYGVSLEAGFDGYLYIPFDTLKNSPQEDSPFAQTDEICGIAVYKVTSTGFTEAIWSVPMFVVRDTLDSNNLPTADAVIIGDRVLEYFGKGSNVPEYYGEKINYGNLDICSVSSTELSLSASIGKVPYDTMSYWDGNSGKAEFIESTIPISVMPMVSSCTVTSADNENYRIGSFGINIESSFGGEAAMFYLRLPQSAKNKSFRVDFGFGDGTNKYNTYTYSGTYKMLERGSDKWVDLSVNKYFSVLPDGFEGYIMVPYSQIVGDIRPTADYAIRSMNLRITDLDGTEPVIFSPPIIVKNIGETVAVYADGATKIARDPFTGESLSYAQVLVDTAGANAGDSNCDGEFNVKDLVRMKKASAGLNIDRTSLLASDTNADAVINASDLNTLRKRLLTVYTVATEKSFLPLTSDGDTSLLVNPDRGFRTHMTLNVKEAVDSGNPSKYYREDYEVFFGYAKEERINLALAYLYLTDYRGQNLPDEAMDAIEEFFKYCELEQFKVMLRFAYCDDLEVLDRGADEATIIRHIEQLKPLIAEYSHCIHTVECGFIGAYGEWESDYQLPVVDYETVIRSIVKNFCEPNNLFFSLRLPRYKNLISSTDPYYSMIALNNDAMFGETEKEGWNSVGYQYGSAEWEQVCQEGAYTPQGGEMLNNATYYNRDKIPSGIEMIKETAHHWHNTMSVWHGMYEDLENALMNNWRSEIVTPQILEENNIVYCPSWFKDDDGNTVTRYAYDFIRDHLGYKIEAQNFTVSGDCRPESVLDINLAVKNYGMSAAFCMNSSFVILDENYNVVSKVFAGNPSEWYSHNPEDYLNTTVLIHNINTKINTPKESGKYYIAFCLENTMEQKARLSNRIEVVNGYNILHEFIQ